MINSRTQSERSVVALAGVVAVWPTRARAKRAGRAGWAVRPEVPAGDGDHSGHGHGHVYDHDLLRLSRD
jgi:hypothetical protein